MVSSTTNVSAASINQTDTSNLKSYYSEFALENREEFTGVIIKGEEQAINHLNQFNQYMKTKNVEIFEPLNDLYNKGNNSSLSSFNVYSITKDGITYSADNLEELAYKASMPYDEILKIEGLENNNYGNGQIR